MNNEIKQQIFDQAKKWVLNAGRTIKEKIDDPFDVTTKSNPNDLVTTMDRDTEQFFAEHIRKNYPDHYILSEEGYGDDLSSMEGTIWIIDPIDGTMNFVHQRRNFAISVGIYHDGIGEIGFIYDVMNEVLYSAKRGEGSFKNDVPLAPLKQHVNLKEAILGLNHFWLCENKLVDEKSMQKLVRTVRGTRTYGSAALEFAYVAEGIVDGYMTMSLAPWDIAAGIIITKEVGAVSTTIDGDEIQMLEKNSILTCHPTIQKEIIQEYMKRK
ncbi:inositol monophosphatase family protein [Oceanobacillus halotolerans]|uniref:inositol monophosphatase family protein n=1 Tax=Oceanobacillus halotolerans TaxID=2663380 RepID=UPI0013DD5796|nr:inositol monophosphatase family protein [Oceanobacillus halotolerans]